MVWERWERAEARAPAPGEVHLWRIEVDRGAHGSPEVGPPLDDEELERARRFHFESDRDRFVTCHVAMREILAAAAGIAPSEVEYRYGSHGKPDLEPARRIHFNLSHTRGLAMIALTCDGPVGVDVEVVRHEDPPLEVADRFFSPAEVRELEATPDSGKAWAFFRCWTRKEAFIKALGEGLSRDLQSFDVSLAPDRGARLVATRPDADEAERWRLIEIDVGPDHAGALVTSGTFDRLRTWHYEAARSRPRGR